MLTEAENKLLTETGPCTPMGNLFRNYWLPACLSRELTADGAPLRLKLLGEDFLAFRDSQGQVGVVEPRCSHRGASLFLGRNEQCGLRCAYHGWKFDTAGNCVDMPNVEATVANRIRDRASIRALQVQDHADIIWVHFGDAEAPPLPRFEFMEVPPENRYVSKKFQQCNWAQAVEGGLDTAHFSYLHAGMSDGTKVGLHEAGNQGRYKGDNEPLNFKRLRWLIEDGAPRFTVKKHKAGLLLCAARTGDEDLLYWRMTQFLMPNHSLTPGNFPDDTSLANTWMPVDDTSCWIFCYAWHPDRPIGEKERERLQAGSGIFAEVDEDFVPIRRRENDYLLSRERQQTHNFTGIDGISEQDQAIADSQGLIADRTNELLVQTDLGVVRFRELVLGEAEKLNGEFPLGSQDPDAYLVRSGDHVASADTDIDSVIHQRFGDQGGTWID